MTTTALHPHRTLHRLARPEGLRSGALARAVAVVLASVLILWSPPASRAAAQVRQHAQATWTAGAPGSARPADAHAPAFVALRLEHHSRVAGLSPRLGVGSSVHATRRITASFSLHRGAFDARTDAPQRASALAARGFDATAPPA